MYLFPTFLVAGVLIEYVGCTLMIFVLFNGCIKSVDYAVPHLLVAAILYAVPHLLVCYVILFQPCSDLRYSYRIVYGGAFWMPHLLAVYTVLHREHKCWSICRATFVNRATFFVLYLLVCRATFVNRTTFTGYIYWWNILNATFAGYLYCFARGA